MKDGSSFKITKINVGQNLDSYFVDDEILTNNIMPLGKYSEAQKVENLYFRNSLQGIYDFHQAPQMQYIIYLSGKTEITTSDGISRIFQLGDILLVGDTYGKGHKTNIIEDGNALIITID